MNIIVCIKQVPDTTEIKIDPKKGTLIREGVPAIINPDDKAAIEYALQLKDKYKAKVTVLTMGLPAAKEALAEAIAMGADKGVLLTDRALGGADTLATSKSIAAAVKKFKPDLIIAGRQAIDGDTAQVGPEMAEHLGIPQITYVSELKYNRKEKKFTAVRSLEDGYQVLKAASPLLVTVLGKSVKSRYMRVDRIVDVANDETLIKTMTAADLDLPLDELGLKGSPTKVKDSHTKELIAKGAAPVDVSPEEAADLIVKKLQEVHAI